jgi:hypothetical protein
MIDGNKMRGRGNPWREREAEHAARISIKSRYKIEKGTDHTGDLKLTMQLSAILLDIMSDMSTVKSVLD